MVAIPTWRNEDVQTVVQLSGFPNLCIPVYLLGVFNIKAEKTFVFMLRSHVMCWGLNDFLRKQTYCVVWWWCVCMREIKISLSALNLLSVF